MKHRQPLILFICIIVSALCVARAVPVSDLFEHPIYYSPIENVDGVDGDIVSIAEDEQGFIWFVSDNGLWRWDAHMAVRASFGKLTNNGIPPQVQTIAASNKDSIWVGTSRGLYRLKTGSRQLVPIEAESTSALSVQNIAAASDPHETVFIATDRELFRYQPDTQTLTPLTLPYESRIHALFVNQGTLWVGTGNGLLKLDVLTPKAGLSPATGFPLNTRVSAISSSSKDSLLVGTANQGLFLQSAEKGFEQIQIDHNSEPWVYSMASVDESTVLLGTFGKGLIEIDLASREWRNSRFDPLHPAGLAHDNVWSLMTDSRGLVWMGVNTALQTFNPNNHGIRRILGGVRSTKGLSKRQVHSVSTYNDQLIVGTGNSGIELIDPATGNREMLWDDCSDPVETLVSRERDSFFASSNFNSMIFNASTKQYSPLVVPGRAPNKYSSAFAETEGVTWIAGTDGLWALSQDAKSARNVLSDVNHERRVASLLASENTLWIGTWRGLFALENPNNINGPIIEAPNAPALLQDQFIATLFIDSLSQLWVGTSNAGFFVYHASRGWRHVEIDTEQRGGRVEAIAGESNGFVFASSSNGILATNTATLEVIEKATAINRPFRRGAATTTTDGTMVFGGANGLTLIDPEQVAFTQKPIDLVLTEALISTTEDRLMSPSLIQHELALPALVKRISFEFAVLDYLAPQKLKYRYRLIGFDENWSMTDSEHRVATYTQPEPGTYTFQVQYSEDGVNWQSSMLERRISIPPAWYQTWGARGTLAFMLSLVAIAFHKLLVTKLRERQIELENRVAARTAELLEANKTLNQQAEALKEASLTDDLTGLNNRRFLTQNIDRDVAKIHRYYADCKKNAKEPDNNVDMLLFLIDIDHFKSINDVYGHNTGDQVLIETQRRLKSVFREIDYLIRWGGEEFLVVVHNTSRQKAKILAERVRQTIGGTPYSVKADLDKCITCSIGYTGYPFDKNNHLALSWEDAIGIADAALYAAKNNSRNTWIGIIEMLEGVPDDVCKQIQQNHSSALNFSVVEKREG